MKTTDELKLGQENPPANEKQAIAPHLTQNRKDIVAYHFCQAADPNTLKLGQILRSPLFLPLIPPCPH